MVKHILIVVWALMPFFATPAAGQEKLDEALERWIKSNGKNVMRQRVLVTAPVSKESFPDVKALKINDYFRMLGLRQPSVVNTKVFYMVNKMKPATAQEAAKALNMDLVIEVGPEKMTITHPTSKKSFSVPNLESEDELVAGLRAGFGYDGYVVDTKENLILARVTGKLLQNGSQAVIIDSAEPFLSTDQKIGASSLIEMVARKGDFGLFRIIIGQAGDTIPHGSRVQFATK